MPKTTESAEPKPPPRDEITVTFTGPPGVIYTNNGLEIGAGETVTITDRQIPRGFKGTLEDLAVALEKVPGMEVA